MFAGSLAPSTLLRLWGVVVVVIARGDGDGWWASHCLRIALAAASLVHKRAVLLKGAATTSKSIAVSVRFVRTFQAS
jgi:hypothetical protein